MPATFHTPLLDQARTEIGLKPVAPPPIYRPEVVVAAIVYAAEHPVRDLVVEGACDGRVRARALDSMTPAAARRGQGT